MKKGILFSVVIILLLGVLSFTWISHSNLANAKEQLQEDLDELEQEKELFKEELIQFEADKEEFEVEKLAYEEEINEEQEEVVDIGTSDLTDAKQDSNEAETTEASEPETVGLEDCEVEPEESEIIEETEVVEETYTEETGEEFEDHSLSEAIAREQELYAQIENIDYEIIQIEQELNNYPDHSDEYRKLLDDQIDLLNQQEELWLEIENLGIN